MCSDDVIHQMCSVTTVGVEIPVRALAAFRAYNVFGLDVQPSDVFYNVADTGWAYGM